MDNSDLLPTAKMTVINVANANQEILMFAKGLEAEGKRPWFEVRYPAPPQLDESDAEAWRNAAELHFDAVEVIDGEIVTLPAYAVLLGQEEPDLVGETVDGRVLLRRGPVEEVDQAPAHFFDVAFERRILEGCEQVAPDGSGGLLQCFGRGRAHARNVFSAGFEVSKLQSGECGSEGSGHGVKHFI